MGYHLPSGRFRNFNFVVYPDSAVDNWLRVLDDMHVPALVSPLHDKDCNPDDGEIKKPHYHVMIMYEGVKTCNQALEVVEALHGVYFAPDFVVKSVRGVARYLCHMDNPEKFQYDPKDVIALAGTDYQDIISIPSDDLLVLRQMINFVDDNHVCSFAQLMRYAMDHNDSWFRALKCNCAYVMTQYIKSATWEREQPVTLTSDQDPS